VQPNETYDLAFPNWTASTPGSFTVRCSTRLTGDQVVVNDTAKAQVTVTKTDAEAVAVLAPTGTIDWNVPVAPQVRVKNTGSVAVQIPARVRIPGTAYNEMVQTPSTVAPDATYDLTFPNWTPGEPGNFTVRCSTELVGDQVAVNDTAKSQVFVRKLDAACLEIVEPTGTVSRGEVVQPKAKVKNEGNVESFFDVTFSIDTEPEYTSTRTTIALAPGAEEVLTFADWTPQDVGDFTMKCTTKLGGDMYPGNDILILPISVQFLDVGVVSITVPQGNYDEGTEIVPMATWRNNGTLAASFEAWMVLSDPTSDARVYTEKVDVVGLAPGQATLVNTFPAYTLETVGNWTVRCSTYYIPDMDPENDILDDGFRVRPVGPGWLAGWLEVEPMPLTQSGKLIKDGGWLATGPDREPGFGIRGSGIGNRGSESGDPITWSPR